MLIGRMFVSLWRENKSNMSDTSNNISPDSSKVQVTNDTDLRSGTEMRKESTRTFIAQLYVWAFFGVIALVLIIGAVSRFTVNDYKDILVTVSGVLSGPLGFIVGYYFKASKE
jgi:hypothetical protein